MKILFMSNLETNIRTILNRNQTYDDIGYHLAKLFSEAFLQFYEINQSPNSDLINCFKQESVNLLKTYKKSDYRQLMENRPKLKNFIQELSYLINNNQKATKIITDQSKKFFNTLNSKQKKNIQKKLTQKIDLPFFAQESITLIKEKLKNEQKIKEGLQILDVNVHDHLILVGGAYSSFADRGLL